jgi:hypothetical protein
VELAAVFMHGTQRGAHEPFPRKRARRSCWQPGVASLSCDSPADGTGSDAGRDPAGRGVIEAIRESGISRRRRLGCLSHTVLGIFEAQELLDIARGSKPPGANVAKR